MKRRQVYRMVAVTLILLMLAILALMPAGAMWDQGARTNSVPPTGVNVHIDLLPTERQLISPLDGPITMDFDLSSVPQAMRPAFTSAVIERPDWLLPGRHFVVTSLRSQDDWALATLAVVDGNPEDAAMDDTGALAILHRDADNTWKVALEGTREFATLLSTTPDRLLSPMAKQVLGLAPSATRSILLAGMKFPWDSSQSWTLTQGWHEGNKVDFAPRSGEPNKWVLAAHSGTITRICDGEASANVQVTHSDGTTTTYAHLDKNSVPSSILGTSIPQGRVIGRLFEGIYNPGPCGHDDQWYCLLRDSCGHSTGPHVHFGLPSQDVTVDGWTSDSDNNWRKGDETKSLGRQFGSSNIRIEDGISS